MNVRSLAFARFRRCHRKGHDWFPGNERMEFLPTMDICLRCNAKRTQLPWGECLGGHRIAEHYRGDDLMVPVAVEDCPTPF